MSSTVITETGCDPHRAASGLDTEIEDLTELSWREKSLYAFSSMCCLKQTNSEKFWTILILKNCPHFITEYL